MSYFLGEFEVRQKPDLSPVTQADLEVETADPGDDRRPVPGRRRHGRGARRGRGRSHLDRGPDRRHQELRRRRPDLGHAARAPGGRAVGARGWRARRRSASGTRPSGEAARDGTAASCHASERKLDDAFMVFSSLDDWLGGPREEAFLELLRDTRRSRGFGDFWGHMLVARGAADVMMEPALRIWDWASIVVIVEEAGGASRRSRARSRRTARASSRPTRSCTRKSSGASRAGEALRVGAGGQRLLPRLPRRGVGRAGRTTTGTSSRC